MIFCFRFAMLVISPLAIEICHVGFTPRIPKVIICWLFPSGWLYIDMHFAVLSLGYTCIYMWLRFLLWSVVYRSWTATTLPSFGYISLAPHQCSAVLVSTQPNKIDVSTESACFLVEKKKGLLLEYYVFQIIEASFIWWWKLFVTVIVIQIQALYML